MKHKASSPPPVSADLTCPQCGSRWSVWREGSQSYRCRKCGASWQRGQGQLKR